jgi:transglutaminase superfamily protein
MTAALTALLLAAASARPGPTTAAPLPVGTARYAMQLGGEQVGLVELSLRCDGPACQATWESRQRLPAEAGGGVRARRVEVPVDRSGRATGPAKVVEPEGTRLTTLPAGAVPVMLVEVALAAAATGPDRRCLEAADERTGASLQACGTRRGEWLEVTVGRERERVRAAAGAFPGELEVPAQGVRFRLDARAGLPAAPPRLFGVRVTGPEDVREAASFCGARRDPEPRPDAAAGLPPPTAPGPTCREQTAAWLARARAAGLRGRTVVGVAFDGGAFVWHAWPEVHVGGRWVAVDPSFRQAPARGPRFTLASFEEGDEAARAEAGRRILGCWGRAAVSAGGRR